MFRVKQCVDGQVLSATFLDTGDSCRLWHRDDDAGVQNKRQDATTSLIVRLAENLISTYPSTTYLTNIVLGAGEPLVNETKKGPGFKGYVF